MRIGCCSNMNASLPDGTGREFIERIKEVGFDYVELPLAQVGALSDKDFSSVSLHSHDFFELYFFIAGDASYIIENGHYRLSTGDILLISPDNLHQLDIDDSRATYERIVLWLNPRYVKRLSTAATDLAECFAACARRKDFLLRDKEVSARVEALLFDLYDSRVWNTATMLNVKSSSARCCSRLPAGCAATPRGRTTTADAWAPTARCQRS